MAAQRVTFRDAPTARQRAAPPPVSAETIATGVVKVVGPILKAQRERLDALEARIRELGEAVMPLDQKTSDATLAAPPGGGASSPEERALRRAVRELVAEFEARERRLANLELRVRDLHEIERRLQAIENIIR